MERCACSIDWVACFRQDCPRAAEIRKASQEAVDRWKAREGEDVRLWAERLGADLAKFTD